MARISDDLINSLKQEVALVAWLKTQGHVLKSHGQDYVMRCPWHEDKTPSLVVSPDTQLWHCMGACQCGGSIIDWVMKAEGVDFRTAVNRLTPLLPQASKKQATPLPLAAALENPLAATADQQTLLRRVVGFYHHTLKSHPEAQAYLEKRGLNHPDLIDHFQLGFANRSLLAKLPSRQLKPGKALRAQLMALGVLRKTGHEHLNGALVVPVLEPQASGLPQVHELYGRKINHHLHKSTVYHLYLPGPHRGVWNVAAFNTSTEIILCEALIDAMTFWVNGFKNVTASYGTAGFTEDHLAAFKTHGIERVLIAYDRDEAGDKAAHKVAKLLAPLGVACFRVNFPKGMDANGYALTVKPARKSLGLVLEKAVYLGQGEAPAITSRGCLAQENDPAKALAEESTLAAYPTPAAVAASQAESGVEVPQGVTAKAVEPSISSSGEQPNTPAVKSDVVVTDREILIPLGQRRYRVRGLFKNANYEALKVNLLVSLEHNESACHVDTLDFYSARYRLQFIKQAALELAVEEATLKKDLAKVLLTLEALQDQNIQSTLKPKEDTVELSPADKADALAFLESPDCLTQLLSDFDRAGVVGEEVNKLVGYLACVSRKLDKPLAIMIQSTSAAGKSALMEAVLAMMPQEQRIQYSAMTGQSLFYMGETNLKHKILAIAEEEGASQASYALKLLQSEGEVTIASTGKDPQTGNLVTNEYRVEGPVMLLMTTTAIDIDEELLNRCLVLTVNESRAQTQAIHDIQRNRQTLAGLLAEQDRQAILKRHQNAQRLLKPYLVVNPYANQLTFLSHQTRTRRDHMKYLQLINSIALLHQYQREIKTIEHQAQHLDYIEVTPEDIQIANAIAHEVLGRSLDELPPQTRRLLDLIHDMVQAQCKAQGLEKTDYRFSRKLIRDHAGWGNTQIKVHCQRLEEMEYLLVHRGRRGQQMEYELLYDGEPGLSKSLPGLIDSDQLQTNGQATTSDANKSGVNEYLSALIARLSGLSRPQGGGVSGLSREAETVSHHAQTPLKQGSNIPPAHVLTENTKKPLNGRTQVHLKDVKTHPSLVVADVPIAATRRTEVLS